jgi:hypothetical protein
MDNNTMLCRAHTDLSWQPPLSSLGSALDNTGKTSCGLEEAAHHEQEAEQYQSDADRGQHNRNDQDSPDDN